MADGSVTIFIERNAGSNLSDHGEPVFRVFKLMSDPFAFESFLGFYVFEPGACCIAEALALPGTSTKVAVA